MSYSMKGILLQCLPTSLTSLRLTTALNDDGVLSLKPMLSIKSLTLHGLPGCHDSSLSVLSILTNLTKLSIQLSSITWAASCFMTLTGLVSLEFNACNILQSKHLKWISNLSWLLHLTLKECPRLKDKTLAVVPPPLRSLSVAWSKRFTDKGFQSLCRLTNLQNLDLSYCSFTDEIGETLSRFTGLTSLGLFGGLFTKEILLALNDMPLLRDVSTDFSWTREGIHVIRF